MSGATSYRRARTCAAVALGVGLLAGCADPTGSNALTQRNYTSADGVMGNSGLITARNVLLVSDGGGAATLSGAFGNNGSTDDSVVSMSALGRPAAVRAGSGLMILPGGSVTFGNTTGGPQAFLSGSFQPGRTVGLRIVFADADQLVLQVPILPRTGYYTSVPVPGTSPGDVTPAAGASAGSTTSAAPTVSAAPATTPAPPTPAPTTTAVPKPSSTG